MSEADNPSAIAQAPPPMDDDAFDQALIAAAFGIAATGGWRRVNVAEAAREAGLPLARARGRFPTRGALLLRFGRLIDQAALSGTPDAGTTRDRLFDLLMRRIDVLQAHRAGVLALLAGLPADPAAALILIVSNRRAMRWMLDAAGVSTSGPVGELRLRGLIAVWAWTIRAWRNDQTTDLSATMAALDSALSRAESAAAWLNGTRGSAKPQPVPAAPSGSDASEPPPETAA
jgi:ubiquinone biosynthesis protein COQ9